VQNVREAGRVREGVVDKGSNENRCQRRKQAKWCV